MALSERTSGRRCKEEEYGAQPPGARRCTCYPYSKASIYKMHKLGIHGQWDMDIWTHMGQFLQDGENGRFVSFFLKKK